MLGFDCPPSLGMAAVGIGIQRGHVARGLAAAGIGIRHVYGSGRGLGRVGERRQREDMREEGGGQRDGARHHSMDSMASAALVHCRICATESL